MITLLKLVFWVVFLLVVTSLAVVGGMIALGVLVYRHRHPKAITPPAANIVYFVAVDERRVP